MAEPYEVLGLAANASEDEIRKRYLELVRQFPPERDPVKFAQVREAYDQLRDPVERMRRRLNGVRETATIDEIAADFQRGQLNDKRITART
ncbi:MAG: DnaJ-class molecular chaperone with C-terminal Zn finger domain, partial [Planctomycetaceae bacterium]|nr:DnaJ-class molecular chaperone with C-terminal Zn finger domain [Planctomycetaceae bacterium]